MMSKMNYLKVIGVLTVSITSTACSGAKLLNAVSKSNADCVKHDVIFDAENALGADIYYTGASSRCNATDNSAESDLPPTLVFVFGGGWSSGDKAEYQFVAEAFVAEGFNVILPNYRLFPEVAYPEFIDDIAQFFVWLDNNASTHSLNKTNLHIMGHSAGAYNLAMYLADKRYSKPLKFKKFVGLAGPYDYFLPTEDPEYITIFERNNPEFNAKSEMPIYHGKSSINDVIEEVFLVHGAKDKIVTPRNLKSFGGHLSALGVTTKTKEYRNKGHVGVVGNLNNVPLYKSEIKSDVVNFLKKN